LHAGAFGRGLHLLQYAVERGAVEQAAVGDYGGDLLRVVNVHQRVGAEQHQVRNFARFHRAIVSFHS